VATETAAAGEVTRTDEAAVALDLVVVAATMPVVALVASAITKSAVWRTGAAVAATGKGVVVTSAGAMTRAAAVAAGTSGGSTGGLRTMTMLRPLAQLQQGTVVVGVVGAGEEAMIVEAVVASMMTSGEACQVCRGQLLLPLLVSVVMMMTTTVPLEEVQEQCRTGIEHGATEG